MNHQLFSPIPITRQPPMGTTPPIDIRPPRFPSTSSAANTTISPVSIDDLIIILLENRNTISQETLQRVYNLLTTPPYFTPSRPPPPAPIRPIMFPDQTNVNFSTRDSIVNTTTPPITIDTTTGNREY